MGYLQNERALIIATSNGLFNNYSNIHSNNLSATGMIVLGSDDQEGLEVLEALENQSINASNYKVWLAGRGCEHAQERVYQIIPEWNSDLVQCDVAGYSTTGRTYGLFQHLWYTRSWIHFSLRAKLRSLIRCTYGGTWWPQTPYYYVDVNLTASVKFKRRCGNEETNSINIDEFAIGGGDGEITWKPYSGGRSLSAYDLEATFKIREFADRTPNPNPWSSWSGEIKYNY